MRSSVLIAHAALGSALLLGSGTAGAQSNAAIAEQLFLDGQKLMDAGRIRDACPKFADSQRLDPAIGTLMHLAACHEKMGMFAAAWSEFNDVTAQAHKANQAEREKYSREHAAALEGKLPKLIIELAHYPEGTTIKLDGAALPLGVLGTEIPVDPGSHSLEVLAPGMKPWKQQTLNLEPRAVATRVQVTLDQDAGQAAASSGPAAPGGATMAPAFEQPEGSSNVTKRVIGYGIGGLGLVSLGVAVGEAVVSVGRSNDENKYPANSPERQTVADQASAARTYAIVFGATGVVAVGAGVYLVLTSKERPPPAPASLHVVPMVGYGLVGAGLHGDW